MENEIVKQYSKGDFSIVWKPNLCIHAAECVKALPAVYNPKDKPWIKQENASVSELKAQIAKCPSGALSWKEHAAAEVEVVSSTSIQVLPNGPLMMHGTFQITQKDGSVQTKEGKTTFCRCGASANKPFCDGNHRKIEFKDE